MARTITACLGLIVLAISACAPSALPAASPAGAPAAPSSAVPAVPFDGARAKAHLDWLADPARGGRFTGSAGFADAARYVADRFAEAGLEPYGDAGTFFQRYRQPLVDLAATPELRVIGGRQFVHRRDFTESVGGTAGSGTTDGAVVFLGTGSHTATLDEWAGVDVKGALLIFVSPRPEAVQTAIAEGAGAVAVVGTQIIKYSYIPRQERLTIPVFVITEATADGLLAGSGRQVADLRPVVEQQSRALAAGAPPPPPVSFVAPGRAHASLRLTSAREVDAFNVVGILRGTDADLAKRAVLVGGHLDGVGTDPDGTVFEAANDNASGPAITLELARVVAARRGQLAASVIFIAFAGEEQGLLGSEHFASQESRVPGRVESLIGFVNLDVAGCCGTTLGASQESRSLYERVQRAGDAEQVAIGPFRGSSDHASFQRRRVDAVELGWSQIGPIHTTADVRGSVTAERLDAVGRVVARVVVGLARGEP